MSGYNPNPFPTLHILADNLRTLPTIGDPEPFFRENFLTTSLPFIPTILLAFHYALFPVPTFLKAPSVPSEDHLSCQARPHFLSPLFNSKFSF